ncbi:hypothetical protein KP509_07G096600 [Ceratopteris richardii]|uniref:Uncharacterized protein n=1 Tax=Ceratopteris richardii TaxID=49495 RepID=A0A8T2UJJ9_CERRI|nr:hypothetical protein KP509_07G096600 [Ceratopteris richardii]KAH7434003.1 hypothetical protein KP509_07G096600 [Ceratopteris richardii]
MPLFRWSCILGGRCMQIKEDEEIPEISGRRNNRICQSQRGLANVDDNEIEQAMLYMYRPCIGSISLGMMVCRPGILIHRDLVLTSHGNLPSFDAAIDSEFVICYLPSSHHRRGIPPKVVLTRRLEPQRYFLTSEVLDLTLVACERVPENISDIVPLSIHQHLGSMNFLEAGHQIYVVGHLNSNDKRGILVCGSAHTVVIPENDLCSNQLIAFTSDLKQDTTGKLWMTGSAGFDEKGEFSFMVVRPQFLYSMNATSDMPDGQFQRKSLENGSVCGIPQYGVPLYIIQDWMLAHGIRDLDNLPSPISSSMSAGFRRVMASLTGSKGIEDHPSNSHSSFTLRDGNSINYVVMDSGSIILEGQSWRNSSPPESFTSYEAAKLGNGSPLERFPTMQLESAMTSGGSRNGDSLNVKEMGCGTTAFVNQEESVVDECCYGPLPKRSVSVQDADLRLLRRSLSQILPSHPLRRRSRTLPSYLRTIDFPDEKQLHYGVTKPCASYLGPDHHEGLDNDKSHDMFSFECINPTPSPQKEYFSESNINDNHTQIRQAMEGDYGSNLSFMDVSSSEVYEEIPLQSQKSSALGESCNENRNNTVFTDNLSIEASNDRHSKDEQIPRSKQEYPSIDNLLFNAGSFEGSNQVTFLKERDKWKPSGKTSRVGHAGASYNNEIKARRGVQKDTRLWQCEH